MARSLGVWWKRRAEGRERSSSSAAGRARRMVDGARAANIMVVFYGGVEMRGALCGVEISLNGVERGGLKAVP